VQPDQSQSQKMADRHTVPAIVIGVTDHEAGQQEEEVDGQDRVVKNDLGGIPHHRDALNVEQHNEHGSGAAQTVEYLEMLLARRCLVRCRI
jgi:hypothetical protein